MADFQTDHNTCDFTGIYAPVQYLHNSEGINEITCLLVQLCSYLHSYESTPW